MASLPRYRNPPLVEVSASVQFESLEGLLAPHLGLIWNGFKSDFPRVEQQNLLPLVVERLTPTSAGVKSLTIMPTVETPRVWFISKDDTELVQIQSNRFIRNWRKHSTPDKKYPHYEPYIRPNFVEDFHRFQAATKELGFSELAVNQCELTYFNRITPNSVWSQHSDLGKILTVWLADRAIIDDCEVETAAVRLTSQIRNPKNGEFLGRQHFEMTPNFVMSSNGESPDGPTPVFNCNFIARGKPTVAGEDGILEFFDLGRRMHIGLFERMFTPEIQKAWGKEEK